MGSLLSLLPLDIISIIFIPSAVSYATSANVLFFYLNWVSLIFTHPPLRLEIVGTLIVKCLFYLGPSWVLWAIDLLLLQRDNSSQKKGKREGMKRASTKIATWATFNVILGVFVQTVLEILITKGLRWERPIRTTIMLPLPWDIAFGVIKALLAREAIGYTLHRFILHDTRLPTSLSFLAQKHKLWYHSLPSLGPLTSTYDHPACYIISRFAPTFLPAILLRLHLITYMIYLILISCEEMLAYCDFEIVSSGHLFIILGRIGRQAQRHLESRGKGNFGGSGVMDWLCGTGVAPEDDDDVVEIDIDDLSDDVKQRIRARTRRKGWTGKRESSRIPKSRK
ncbi:hypothetical protein KEM56_000544 [Ascosphaera pollenicola]|nr:hypothetical protein KEM56_000544 [Ascosphaera pollenicola]